MLLLSLTPILSVIPQIPAVLVESRLQIAALVEEETIYQVKNPLICPLSFVSGSCRPPPVGLPAGGSGGGRITAYYPLYLSDLPFLYPLPLLSASSLH